MRKCFIHAQASHVSKCNDTEKIGSSLQKDHVDVCVLSTQGSPIHFIVGLVFASLPFFFLTRL